MGEIKVVGPGIARGYPYLVCKKEHGLCACTERQSPSFSDGIIDRTGAQTMLYLTCTTISRADLAEYGVSLAKNWYLRNVVQHIFHN